MSARFLTTTTRAAARPAFILPLTARRSLSQTLSRPLKESSSSTYLPPPQSLPFPNPPFANTSTADPNPEGYEHHKKDSLEKQKQGKGHWKPELASVSEESVKADRSGQRKTDKESLKKLQEETKGSAEETSKKGTSMRDGL
jgi:hypothetical protein